jgi:hypothetical protein
MSSGKETRAPKVDPTSGFASFVSVLKDISPVSAPTVQLTAGDQADALSVHGVDLAGLKYQGFDPNVIRSEAILRLGYLTSITVGTVVAQNGTKKLWDRDIPVKTGGNTYVKKKISELGLSREKTAVGQQVMEKNTLTPSRIMHAFAIEVTIWLARQTVFKRVSESRLPAPCQHAAAASLPWDESFKGEVKEFAKQFSFIINQAREKDKERSIRLNFSEQIFEQQWSGRFIVKLDDPMMAELANVMRM